MQRSRLLVTDAAELPPRQATGSLIMTLGRNMKNKAYTLSVYLTPLIVAFSTVGILLCNWLTARSEDSNLRVYIHDYSAIDRMFTQRYLQFTRTAGILLYGYRREEKEERYATMQEPWGISLKPYPYFPEDIEKENTRTREGRERPSMFGGFHVQVHEYPEKKWYAKYRYISLRWMSFYFVLMIISQITLHIYLIKKQNK